MYAHGVKVFDGTDNDTVILAVTDDFHLILFPSKQRLFNKDLRDRRSLKSAFYDLFEFIHVIGYT